MSKPGRNDPCYCGSGQKYKRCCLEKDQLAERAGLEAALPEPDLDYHLSVAEIHSLIDEDMVWHNALYPMLAHHLTDGMEPYFEEQHIIEAVSLWNEFSNVQKPLFRKFGAYCAALEYLVCEAHGIIITQAELAKKYQVSVATISKRFQELNEFAENHYGDMLDEYENGDHEDLDHEVFQLPPLSQKSRDALPLKSIKLADELLQRAELQPNRRQRLDLIQHLLELNPYCADAYLLLAGATSDPEQAYLYLRHGLQAAELDLGEGFIAENRGDFWLIDETRPFIRIKFAYAELCWELENQTEAIHHLEDLLSLSPNDSVGARYLLLAVYLDRKRLDDAERLLETYEDDIDASFAYDRVILEFLRHGKSARLKMLYRNARKANRHVPDYLLGLMPLPETMPDLYSPGDSYEAALYVNSHFQLWIKLPRLLEWMAGQ